MRLRKVINGLMIGCLSGIYLARFTSASISTFLLVGLALIFIGIKLPKTLIFVAISIGIMIGLARSTPLVEGYDRLAEHEDQKVSIEATIISDPVYHSTGQFEFNANDLRLQDQDIRAIIRVRSFTNDVRRGDRVRIEGKMRDGFAYWQASTYFAELELIDRDSSNLNKLRADFISNIFSTIPDPEGSLGLGFLIGVRSLLPDELVGQLSATGLTHIVAVSGYNLTILASMSKQFFHRFSRFQAVFITFSLILAFVTITGVSPSILRAVIVSTLSIGAWYYGRSISAWLLLLCSSSLSAMINPAYAWSDIGWYLSLFAFFGVLIVAPLVQQKLFKEKQPKIFAQVSIETTSAQLMTLPIIMLVFGRVSLVALLANVLVLPLIPLSMLMTFLVGTSYFISHTLAGVVAVPTYLLLQFITNIVRLMSEFTWALVDLRITAVQLVVIYLLIAIAWIGLRRKPEPNLL